MNPRGLLAGLLAAASLSSQSAPVTFAFDGAVTSDPFGLSSAGAPISGSFTFDTAASDAVAAANVGSFASSGPGFGFSANVDGYLFAVAGSVTVVVANDIGVDQYGAIASDAGLTLELFFEDGSQSALSSDTLPLAPPSLGAFGLREFRLFSADAEFLGSIDALRCVAGCGPSTPVPVAPTLWLGAVGLALAMPGRWRRRGPR